jgi:cell fate regulator YaaT (PSP1 superfamily)
MTESREQQPETSSDKQEQSAKPQATSFYRVRFREQGQEFTARTQHDDLVKDDTVMVRTDHNPEPAVIVCKTTKGVDPEVERGASYDILRRATPEEKDKYLHLALLEKEAFDICLGRIVFLCLPMNLVRVERFFNGSKIIFYFTAESRVDFRELVKNLVQEFRTRVEMRQIGVRHETQMIGGIGACGRELCCTSFLNKFESVSIKMAKTQDLPLNPAKISGVCNRLLCCLTYEYDSYKSIKKEMPRIGRQLKHEGAVYRVTRIQPLQGTIKAVSREYGEVLLTEEQWRAAKPVRKNQPRKKNKNKSRKKSSRDNRPEKD